MYKTQGVDLLRSYSNVLLDSFLPIRGSVKFDNFKTNEFILETVHGDGAHFQGRGGGVGIIDKSLINS